MPDQASQAGRRAGGSSGELTVEDARFDLVMGIVNEISRQRDPQELVSVFRRRATVLFGDSGSVSLSRRNLERPFFKVTRSSTWAEDVNPWKQGDSLPVLQGGILSDLIYADTARIIPDVTIDQEDPALPFLPNAKSLLVLPLFDEGHALNMVVRFSDNPRGFDGLDLAESVLRANLFGLATRSLVLRQQLESTYAELDRELHSVGEIQRLLLPAKLPEIPGTDIAASYSTAARAGGDYYDFIPLDNGRWGMLIADVSGHGTPAAVYMAILRTMLHAYEGDLSNPANVLTFVNRRLQGQFGVDLSMFVTAFYGIYNPEDGSFEYACAGHNPPLSVDRQANVRELDEAQGVPLGVLPDYTYAAARTRLRGGDTLLLYTDGITEAMNDKGEMYGRTRLLSCVREDVSHAQSIIDCVTYKLLAYTGQAAQEDDRTLVAVRVLKE